MLSRQDSARRPERPGREDRDDRRLRRTPSVAHAEALLRGVERRGRQSRRAARRARRRRAVGRAAPAATSRSIPSRPRRWRSGSRFVCGVTPSRAETAGRSSSLHSLRRRSRTGRRTRIAQLFDALGSADPGALAPAERPRRSGRPRPRRVPRRARLPSAAPLRRLGGCAPALSRLGRVIVAGSRDAVAARTLGFVPSHSISSALEMAHGVAGGRARVGVLLAPPYSPLLVSDSPATSRASSWHDATSLRRGTSCGPARSSCSSVAGPSSAIWPVSMT